MLWQCSRLITVGVWFLISATNLALLWRYIFPPTNLLINQLTFMKIFRLFCLATLLLQCATSVWSQQYTMPQDNWYGTGFQISGNFGDITIGPDNNIYVANNNSSVSVYSTNGIFLRNFGTNMNITGIAVSSQTNVYVLDMAGTNHVEVYSPSGQLFLSFGSDGTNFGQISFFQKNLGRATLLPHGRIAIGTNGYIYVADQGNNRVQSYDTNGNTLTNWGQYYGSGSLPFGFYQLGGISVLPGGQVCVENFYVNGCFFLEIQMFDANGNFLMIKPQLRYQVSYSLDYCSQIAPIAYPTTAMGMTPDGFIWAMGQCLQMYFGDTGRGTLAPSFRNLPQVNYGPSMINNVNAIAFDLRGTMYITTSAGLFTALRLYGSDAPAQATPASPQPYIIAVNQRTNSTLVDIDYSVVDVDTNQVNTALLAFANNGNDLTSVLKPTVFSNNTVTNVGSAIPTNVKLRVTWDASQAVTDFTNLQFEALASDGRTLLPLNFITIPAFQTNASFTMSRSPVQDSDLLSIWFWLLATNNPSITLTNGTIVGVGGTYNGLTLASSSSTTLQGRAFLYQLLHVRVPTANQVATAQSGNFGFISIDPNNSVVKLP